MADKVLFLATGNKKKIEEITPVLGEGWLVKSFLDMPAPLEVEETEPTLEGNAILKARAYYEATSIPCIADDTGLEVEALHGAPGVYSARYAGEEANPVNNMAKLLRELSGVTHRTARFRTVIAFYDGAQLRTFEGELKGAITTAPRGTGGFGYDPVFQPHGYDRTLGEMLPEEKNQISHRALAVRAFQNWIQQTFA